jgi:hypothetical protein
MTSPIWVQNILNTIKEKQLTIIPLHAKRGGT